MRNVITLIICFVVTANFAWAGDSSGKVQHIMVHKGDVVMFSAGIHNNKPSCSTVGEHWALSLSTENGKAMYAMLLSATAQGKTINVKGEDVCNAWGDRESPKYMSINY